MDKEKKDTDKIKELEKKIENLEKEKIETEAKNVELENNWKRALADYKNLERRTAEDREAFINFANETLIRSLLPIVDHMEMLLAHFPDESLKMILKDFHQTLKAEGVLEIETLNKDFDENTMDAVEMVEGEKNKVVEVLAKGYFLKNKLLRPARVKVGQGN